MDARCLFALNPWRIARIERPLLALDTISGRAALAFDLRDLARGCLLARDRVELDEACPRWRALRGALGQTEVTSASLPAALAGAELDVALGPLTGQPSYRPVPELAGMRA